MWFATAARRYIWFSLRWPHEVTSDHVSSALLALNGSSTPRRADSIVLAAFGRDDRVAHYIAVPDPREGGVRHQLEATIPGLAVEPVDIGPRPMVDRAWRCWTNTRKRPLDTRRHEAVARSLVAALASAGEDELLAMSWVLGPVRRPSTPATGRAKRLHRDLEPVVDKWVLDLLARPDSDDAQARTALAHKQAAPGWRATLHLGVAAGGRRRQRLLLAGLAGAVRMADGPGAQLGFRPARRSSLEPSPLLSRRPLLVNVDELRGLVGWPIGPTDELPVAGVRSRQLPPTRAVPSGDRIVAEATYPSGQRPYALSAHDALHHLHVIGPTGVGKTTLLLNLICHDMAAGRSVVVVEPRGDLVADVLARVPDPRVDDVVVIDPTDDTPVGLNPLAAPGVAADLRADHLLTVFKHLWADSWGPRTQDILTSGLLTLTVMPGLSLAALPVLFADEDFRRRLVDQIHDPLGLGTFWAWYEGLSEAEQASVLAPVMNKLRAFLLRERLRRVIGQSEPRFDLREIYWRRRIVLVNLATGALGSEAAALLGSLVVSQLWQTLLGRAGTAPERRHPVMVFIDEFQKYLHLPTDLADVLAQARGLGVGLSLAHQHLGQLHSAVEAAVLANARSRVVFATNHDDAQALARTEPRLKAADLVNLGRYEAYVSLLAGSESTPYASARTMPPPPAVRPGDDVRQRSREQWGVPAAQIDAELAALTTSDGPQTKVAPDPDETVGERPRAADDKDEVP